MNKAMCLTGSQLNQLYTPAAQQMLLFACDPPQETIDISSMPILLEVGHDIAHFQDMSQGHTVYNTKQDFSKAKTNKSQSQN